MDIGGERYAAVGRVHAIPVADVAGTLILCGLDAIGPDPAGFLAAVEGDVVVCLQTDHEIDRRHPDYRSWLADPSPHDVIRLPTEDHMVADDELVVALIADIHRLLTRGRRVVVHCGAGWGRAGVVAVLLMCAAGAGPDDARRDLRDARPAAGPQSADQDRQVERLVSAVRAATSTQSSP